MLHSFLIKIKKSFMDNLLDLLQGQLGGAVMDQLSNQLGAKKEETAAATDGIISMLTTALAKNAATPEGASALANALDNDHDGSILDNLGDLMSGNLNSRAANGAGILKHILGGKQANAIDVISQMSGLSSGKTGNLMTILAPMVLGMLGKEKRTNNLDTTGISDILTRSVKSATNKRQEMNLIEKFIDQDGDGSIMDDLANMGMKMFGNMFKR